MIQLRQADAITITANGEYECDLSKDVIIESGDVVQLSKAFIDSVKEGDVNISEDLILTIQSGVYFTNWTTLGVNPGSTSRVGDYFINNQGEKILCFNGGNPGASAAPCFKRFIPYLPISDLVGYSRYQQYEYLLVYKGNTEPPFTITYSYVDFSNKTQYFHTTFPGVPAGSYNQKFMDNFNIIAKTGSVNIVSPSLTFLASFGLTPVGAISAGVVDTKNYVPFTFTTNINLPSGIYSPTEISTYISQQLSQSGLTSNSTYTSMNDTFFQFAITDFDSGKANPNGQLSPNPPYLPVDLTEQTTFISDDGILSYQFAADNNSIIGTSQIALEFNSNSNAFQFTYCHMPMLDASTGQNMSVRYLSRGLVQNAGVYGVTENSGIYFNSLIAKNSSGRLVDFWSGILGFDLDSLCVNNNKNSVIDTYGLFGIINLSNPLIDGVSATSGYYGLDSAIIRGTGTNPNIWYKRQTVPYYDGTDDPVALSTAQDGICSTINSTNYISATRTLDVLLNKFSHYVLQTDLGFNDNNFIGEKWYRNINGIISKYYSYGSYSFAESDSAIQYIHKGAPIQLKSVRVRLLKSDMKLDENLGEDNTIIMQVIKAGTQLLPVDTPKKA